MSRSLLSSYLRCDICGYLVFLYKKLGNIYLISYCPRNVKTPKRDRISSHGGFCLSLLNLSPIIITSGFSLIPCGDGGGKGW